MPRSRSRTGPAACLAAVAFALAVGGAPAADAPLASVDEAGWQGVLGVRPPVSVAQRHLVLLRDPSLASRVRAAGGRATEAEMRRWTAAAEGVQEQFLRRVSASGAQVQPEYRYVRLLNGFSARLDPNSLALLERDPEVAGIYPVRVAYPAAEDETVLGAAPPAAVPSIPGLDGKGVVVALLDTGVDRSHPYLRDNVLPGIDVITPGSGGIAQPHPTIQGRPERHGTELAGIVIGSDGPGGVHGVAPDASILPIRVAGWQPDAEGDYAVYSRTDQVLAGLEAAADPNDDGDAHDAARIALIGVAEPYAAFPDGPLARAIDGAAVLDMLVVVPAGNDGSAGPAFGSIAGPGGTPEALTVGATDGRPSVPTVRVHVRAGLRVLFDGVLPLAGSPEGAVTAEVVPVTRALARQGLSAYFDDGVSTTAGTAVLLPRGALSDETVEEAARSGALSVLVDGSLPPGAFGLDVPAGVPVVGLPADLARSVRAMRASGIPVVVSVGAAGVAENAGAGGVAPFSSQGLAFGGVLKPELLAPGVSIATSEPGLSDQGDARYATVSGTSAAAAVTAGAAAVLAAARPRAGALDLKSLLVGSARGPDDPGAAWTGTLDLEAALRQEIVVEPAVLSFPPVSKGAVSFEQTIRVRNVSTRRLFVPLSASSKDEDVEVAPVGGALRLRPGRSGEVVLRADVGRLSEDTRTASGELVLHVAGSGGVRLPWVLAVPDADADLVSQVSLSDTGDRVSDATPAVVSFVVGAIEAAGGDPQVRSVDVLDVQLWRESRFLGVLSQRRELLPGRYAFGLTGRGPRGEPLPRGRYLVRLVARPEDGTRRQVEQLDYVVR